jgi:hypothetical protein
MAKKQIDEKIQAKFDKPQFSIGTAVYFSFLGQKQYGYVTKIKKTTWGIQYNVQSATGSKYPCGICIKGIKTAYDTGFIYFDESKQIGSDECRRRYDASRTGRTNVTLSIDARRSTFESDHDNTPSQSDADSVVRKMDERTGDGHGTTNVDKSSFDGVPTSNRKTRSNSKNVELTDAIQKQRNFLNGFVKKD